MNLVNHQFRLAARPVGMPKRSDWSYTEEPVRRARRRRVPGQGALYLARPRHARLDERRQIVYRAGGDRRCHACPGAGRVIASQNPGFAVGDMSPAPSASRNMHLSNGEGVMKIDVRLRRCRST